MPPAEIAVVGAGPAGLMAAWEAARLGHRVTVVEAADRVGGLAGSFEVAGQRVDFGSHRLHPNTPPALMARLQALLGDDLQVRERRGRIRLDNRWVGFPLRMLDLARHLPPSFTWRAAVDTLGGPWRGLNGDTFADVVCHRLGPTVFEEFYGPYARKLYGVPPTELSSELADRRIAATSPLQVLGKVVRATRPAGRTFLYPRRGYGQIAERLADAVTSAGGDIHLGQRVDQVTDGDRPTVTAGGSSWEVDAVLSTMALPHLLSSLRPSPPTEVTTAAASLRVRAMVLVYLVVPRPQYTPFDAHYLPQADLAVGRVSEPKNYRDGDDPADHTVLCAELACWEGDDIWRADTMSLAALVAEELQRAGLPAPGAIAHEIRRLPRIYPVYETRTTAQRSTVEQWCAGRSRVITLGRQGLGVPDNLHHVLAMGSAAAAAIQGHSIATERWQGSLSDFARHVVED